MKDSGELRILVVRMDAIGDTLLSLPAIHTLRRHFPQARLTVLASAGGAAVLADDPALSEVVVPADVRTFVPPEADMAFTFTEKLWGYQWLERSGASTRIGFWPGRTQPLKSLQISRVLTHRVRQQQDPRVDQGIHEVERYMRLLEPLGIVEAAPSICVHVPAEAHQAVAAWLQQENVQDFTLLHLSEKWLRGGWRLEFLQKLSDRLPRGVVVYGPAERTWASQVQARRTWFDPDIKRYAALLSRARALVTMDTSAAHLAAAVGVPLVDVFPPHNYAHNTTRWRPWKVPHILLQKQEQQKGDVSANEDALVNEILQALERLPNQPCRSVSA